MKIVALLPMKGNSERIPHKNMRDFHGRPLYHSVVETLLKSKYIDKIIINTDSKLIRKDGLDNFGDAIQFIDRPKSLQGDFVSMNKIINYDISVTTNAEHFIQTHSTNPLIKTQTLNNAIEKYFDVLANNTFNSVFSVTRHQTRFYCNDGKPINHNPEELMRTQDLPVIYEENSNFYIFSRASFNSNNKKRIGTRPFLFEVDKMEAIDIDEPSDFILAEKLYYHE